MSGHYSHLIGLAGSQDLCVDSPGPDAGSLAGNPVCSPAGIPAGIPVGSPAGSLAGSPAGSAVACAPLASELLVVGTTLPGSG